MTRLLYTFLLCTSVFCLAQSQVIINEISYNPPESGNDSLEYIELYNASDVMVHIGGWYFQAGVIDTLPAVDMQPGEYFVTAINASAMQNVFGVTAHQWANGALSNGGEVILLVDAGGNFIDSVLFDDAAPWPLEADGSGPSLELKSPELDNNDGANWQFSGGSTGVIIEGAEVMGTPGAQNSGGGTPGPAVTIDLFNFAFHPPVAVVAVGDIVRWVNNEAVAHNVNGQVATFPDNPEGFFSGAPAVGPWEYDFQFNAPGTYQYQCDPHASQGMTGTIYVYDPLTYNDFPLTALRLTNDNGSALFHGVPTSVTGVVHGINFQPSGYSYYIINPDNIGINVFSFDPGDYVVTEGDEVTIMGTIDQFNGLLEIIPDTSIVLSTGNALTAPTLFDELTESLEGSHVAAVAYSIDSIVTTGSSGYNVFVTREDGYPILIRVDADLGVDIGAIESSNTVRGICTQFDPSFPFTEGYQVLALEFLIVDGLPVLDKEAITMVPNPAMDQLTFSGDLRLSTIEIYSLNGKQLIQKNLNSESGEINISALPAGMHFVKVTTDQGTWTSLLAVMRN